MLLLSIASALHFVGEAAQVLLNVIKNLMVYYSNNFTRDTQ